MQFVWAWRIEQLGLGRARYDLVNQHKSIGLTILGLLLLRLLWRSFNPPPLLPPMPVWQRRSRFGVQSGIYLLLILLPPVGWAMSSAAGFVVSWFDLFDLPALLEQDDAMKDSLKTLHAVLAALLAILVSVHVLAALYHHFKLKDDVLRSMLPGRQKR